MQSWKEAGYGPSSLSTLLTGTPHPSLEESNWACSGIQEGLFLGQWCLGSGLFLVLLVAQRSLWLYLEDCRALFLRSTWMTGLGSFIPVYIATMGLGKKRPV